METLPFLRIGDKVIVKSPYEISSIKGMGQMKHIDGKFYATYKGMNYEFYSEEEMQYIGDTGVVISGVYDTYLRVRMSDGMVKLFPHFALKLN